MFGLYFVYWVFCIGWWISIPIGLFLCLYFWICYKIKEKRRIREEKNLYEEMISKVVRY